MHKDYFRVEVGSLWREPWPEYFEKFWVHCNQIAEDKHWKTITVANYQLYPHGKLIQTKTQGWYLRWDDEKYHNMFVLKWS